METNTLITIFGTILTGVGLWIAWSVGKANADNARRQAENAEAKLRLELFEKRYRIYSDLDDIFARMFNRNSFLFEDFDTFRRIVIESGVLFDASVTEFIIEIRDKALSLASCNDELEDLKSNSRESKNRRAELLKQRAEIRSSLHPAHERFRTLFIEYMRILPVAEKDSSKGNEHRRFGWLLSRTGGGKSELNGD